MKQTITQWYEKTFIHKLAMQRHMRWVKNNNKLVSLLHRDTIVYQMWLSGIRFEHINKWLAITGNDTIKAYGTKDGSKDVKLFYKMPGAEERAKYRNITKVV